MIKDLQLISKWSANQAIENSQYAIEALCISLNDISIRRRSRSKAINAG